jgi:HEAT repeat protein/MFS family permease
MARLFDVREGEARGPILGLTCLLTVIVAAHTVLETARDALLLTGPGPKALGAVYVGIAAGAVPAAALAGRVGERLGQRRALAATLLVGIIGPVILFLAPPSHTVAIAAYLFSGVLASVVVPQFWTLAGLMLTVGQGRRLFGIISSGGVIGGIAGPAAASGLLAILPLKYLLLLSSSAFAGALLALLIFRNPERASESADRRRGRHVTLANAFRETPFLGRVAAVVSLSTATFLGIDYLFKFTLTRALPSAQIAAFIAHYYLVLNVLSLVVQLASSGLVRRLGLVAALAPTPILLMVGALIAFTTGGTLPGVLVVKTLDGGLRYSLHRVTGELMYLPLPSATRQRTKALVDGGLGRISQAVTGAALLAIGGSSVVGARTLAVFVVVLAALWVATVVTMRTPYLKLLRNAIRGGSLDEADTPEPLDLDTAQVLVHSLANEDPTVTEGAMLSLSRHGAARLIPALVLLHRDAAVLQTALEMFGAGSRTDWFSLARNLLEDPREIVRVAAARALARHEQLDPRSLAHDVGWRARGYVAVRQALRTASGSVTEQEEVALLLQQTNVEGRAARLGLLAAIADAAPTPRLHSLLMLLAREPGPTDREHTELLARAATQQNDRGVIPLLIPLLAARDGREAVRASLVSFGEPALDQVLKAFHDPARDRRLRLHLPKTIARFATRRAADALLEGIETEHDGLVRYKGIRALRALVTAHRIVMDRLRVERLATVDLTRRFTHLATRCAISDVARPNEAMTVLAVELLEEKAAHALERAFDLLQIAHPRQGVYDAYVACGSADAYTRANGAELVDALLQRRDQGRLRALFHYATDDLSAEESVLRVQEMGAILRRPKARAIEELLRGDDTILAAIARRLCALEVASPSSPPVGG